MNKLFYRFRRDIKGIVFLGLGIFIGLALISFSPQDPSFNSIGQSKTVLNFCGYAGSFLADLLYQFFGFSAWLIVAGLFKISYNSFQGDEVNLKTVGLAWGAVLMLTFASLLAVYFPVTRVFQEQIYISGLIGLGISKVLIRLFNTIGVTVILWSLLLILVVFYSEKTVQELCQIPLMLWKKVKESSFAAFFVGLFDKASDTLSELPAKKSKQLAVATPQGTQFKLPGSFFPIKENSPAKKTQKSREEEAEQESDEDDLDAALELAPVIHPKQDGTEAVAKRRVVVKAKTPRKVENWTFPKLSLLEDPPASRIRVDEKEIKRKAELLTDKLAQFQVKGSVVAAKPGPAVTMFEFKPNVDVRLSKITDLADDLSLALSSESVRIIAPIPGRDVVGIETSNSNRETVYLKDIIAEDDFWSDDMKLPIPLGREVDGSPKIVDLRKMPHVLVAGTTGSGKSVFTVSTITGLLFKHSPKTLRMILIDPKQVDLAAFADVPHLIMPPIREPKKAVSALRWAVKEMEKRYKSMSKFGARGLEDYNEKVAALPSDKIAEYEKFNEELENQNQRQEQFYYTEQPYIVIVVEEFADLMTVDKINVEQSVVRLAQMARACGIHLILAMQSPRKEVVTGLIKTNIPGRISFKVASKMDSRIILDEGGAERLLARGDMLYLAPSVGKPARHHGPWLSDKEINSVAQFWSDQGKPEFDMLAMRALEGSGGGFDLPDGGSEDAMGESDEYDERYDEILSWASSQKEISASLIQRKFRLGYPRAARMIEVFEREGVVGPSNGSKPRQVLVTSYKE